MAVKQLHSFVGANWCGLDYDGGMARLTMGVEAGEVVIVSYSIDGCARGVFSLDVEGEFDEVFDRLSYLYETVWSDDSMFVWFGVQTRDAATLADRVMAEIRKATFFSGLRVTIGDESFVM